jgi:hypothetical protein
VLALLVTGLFTLPPRRVMNKVAFGPEGATPEKLALLGLVLLAVAATSWAVLRWRSTPPGKAFIAGR